MSGRLYLLGSLVGAGVLAIVFASPSGRFETANAQFGAPPCFATPNAITGPDQSVSIKGPPVTLDGSQSYDGEWTENGPPCAGNVVQYQWDFGDGRPKKLGKTLKHKYREGEYEATLGFVDLNGDPTSIGSPDTTNISVSK